MFTCTCGTHTANKMFIQSNKCDLNQTLFQLFFITWEIKLKKSLEISTQINTKTIYTLFVSHQKSLETLQLINKIKAWIITIITIMTYLAWNSRSSRDTFGSLKISRFRRFRVQEFSSNTKRHELALQRGKLGRLSCAGDAGNGL